jgi:hypothetical protein
LDFRARIYQGIHYRSDNVASHQIARRAVEMGPGRVGMSNNQ